MLYFLGLMLFGVMGFTLLLVHYDITPREAGHKMLRRVLKRPIPKDVSRAPYARKNDFVGGLHRPILLNIETADGTGQASHPDIAYVAGGFGSGNWCYWMVCTPYPYENRSLENPEIFASHDGITWEIPNGVQNPIVPALPKKRDHNSDPEMIFYDEKLWLYYREVTHTHNSCENRILMIQSSDGIKWSEPLEVIKAEAGTEILSPTVIKHQDAFFMWTVEKREQRFEVAMRKSRNGVCWNAPSVGKLIGVAADRHIWHLDAIEEENRLSALVVTTVGNGGGGARIHYSYSEDGGITWIVGPFLMDQIYEFESKCQYRASFRKVQENPDLYEIWYSAASKKSIWSIAYMQYIRDGNLLYPRKYLFNDANGRKI